MASDDRIPEIKEWYNALLSQVTITRDSQTYGFADIGLYPPPIAFPGSHLILNQVAEDDKATGGLTEDAWEFIHTVTVDYSGATADALEELERLVAAVMTRVRRLTPDEKTLPSGIPVMRVDLDGSRVFGTGEIPETGSSVAFKDFLLTVVTEEI